MNRLRFAHPPWRRRLPRAICLAFPLVLAVALSTIGAVQAGHDGATGVTATVAGSDLHITRTEGPPELPRFLLPYAAGADVYWTGGPHALEHGGDLGGTFPAGHGSGLDFAGTEDKSGHFRVLAIADGTVERVTDTGCDDSWGLGCWVAVRHDVGSTVAVYGHLQPGSINLSENAEVDQGDVLGRAGQSGRQDNVHLHLDLRHGNVDCATESEEEQQRRKEFDRQCFFGDPFGWDDGIPFINDYYIFGYLVDGEAVRAYNYDGTAVRIRGSAEARVVHEFPYVDRDSSWKAIPRQTIARVSSTYDCESDNDCENNKKTTGVQFAGHGASFGTGQEVDAQAFDSGGPLAGGRLISTNVTPKNGDNGGTGILERLVSAVIRIITGVFERIDKVTRGGGRPEAPGPAAVAREFFSYVASLDAGGAAKRLHPEGRLANRVVLQAAFGILGGLSSEFDASALRYDEESNDGTVAVVRVSGDLGMTVTVDNEVLSDTAPFEARLRLEKVKGKWYISASQDFLDMIAELERAMAESMEQ